MFHNGYNIHDSTHSSLFCQKGDSENGLSALICQSGTHMDIDLCQLRGNMLYKIVFQVKYFTEEMRIVRRQC